MIASGNENRGGAVTSHDVARLAGVSQATVSRVLRQDPKVRPETRDRVLRVLAETRYEPNAAVRAFRTRGARRQRRPHRLGRQARSAAAGKL